MSGTYGPRWANWAIRGHSQLQQGVHQNVKGTGATKLVYPCAGQEEAKAGARGELSSQGPLEREGICMMVCVLYSWQPDHWKMDLEEQQDKYLS